LFWYKIFFLLKIFFRKYILEFTRTKNRKYFL
jgi:hypothetical protein